MARSHEFTEVLVDWVSGRINQTRFNNLWLGGGPGTDGGSSYRPIEGQLTQRHICYDTTETASPCTPSGFSSLVDNLRRIRYWQEPATWFGVTTTTSGLQVYIKPGLWYPSTTEYCAFAGGNSPTFTCPDALDRIDTVYVDSAGTLHIKQGTPAVVPTITLPSIASGIPLWAVYLTPTSSGIMHAVCSGYYPGMGYIERDLRPFLNLGGGGGVEEGPGIDVVNQTIVGLGGDTILIYDSGGDPVAEYAATQVGLDAAIAAAASGDAVALPAGEHDWAVTLKDGVKITEQISGSVIINRTLSDAAIICVSGGYIKVKEIRVTRTSNGNLCGVYANHAAGSCIVHAELVRVELISGTGSAYGVYQSGAGTLYVHADCEASAGANETIGATCRSGPQYIYGNCLSENGAGSWGVGAECDAGTQYVFGNCTATDDDYVIGAGASGGGYQEVHGNCSAVTTAGGDWASGVECFNAGTIQIIYGHCSASAIDDAIGAFLYDGDQTVWGSCIATATTSIGADCGGAAPTTQRVNGDVTGDTYGADCDNGTQTITNSRASGGTADLRQTGGTLQVFSVQHDTVVGTITWLDGDALESLRDYAQGSIVRGGASDWEAYDAKTEGAALIGTGADIVSDLTPLWKGKHTFEDGIIVETGVALKEQVVAGADVAAYGQVWVRSASPNELWFTDDEGTDVRLGVGSAIGGGGNPAFKCDGTLVVLTTVDGAYIVPAESSIEAVYLHCATPGSAGSTIVDVNKNGVSIFNVNPGNRAELAWDDANGVAKSGGADVTDLDENDVLTVDIDQVATGAADMTVIISLYLSVPAGSEMIGARVYNSGNINIPHAAGTTLTFDSERFDTDDIHSVAVNTSRLTCTSAGVYIISGTISFTANANGGRALWIVFNGTPTIASTQLGTCAAVTARVEVSTIYELAVGDYVELKAYQTSGGPLNVVSSGNFSPEFAMVRAARHSKAGELPLYARGSIIRGGALDWETYNAKTNHQILVGDGTDVASKDFDWDDMAAGGAADMVHDHTSDAEGGVLSAGDADAVGARVYNDANIDPAVGVWVSLTFNSERFDTDAFHSVAVNTNRLTIPTGDNGVYLIGGSVFFSHGDLPGGHGYELRVLLNGTTPLAQQDIHTSGTTRGSSLTITTAYSLSATDYVELQIYTSRDVNVDAVSNKSPEFWITKVGAI